MVDVAVVKAGEEQEDGRDKKGKEQGDGGGVAQTHGQGHPLSRRCAPAHPLVDRAAQAAQAEGGGEGGDELEQGALCRQQHRRPCEKGSQHCAPKHPAQGPLKGNVPGKGVGPEAQDDENLNPIVDQLPLFRGEIALAGVVGNAQDGELEEDEGGKESGQGDSSTGAFWHDFGLLPCCPGSIISFGRRRIKRKGSICPLTGSRPGQRAGR